MAEDNNAPAPERWVSPTKGLAGRFHADFLNLCGVLVAVFITTSEVIGPLTIVGTFILLLVSGTISAILIVIRDHVGALNDQQQAQSKTRLKTIFRVSLIEAGVFAAAFIVTVIILATGTKEEPWGSEILAPLAFAIAVLVIVQFWFYSSNAHYIFKNPEKSTLSLRPLALALCVDFPILLGILAVATGAAWSGATAISKSAHPSGILDVPALIGAAGWILIELVSGIRTFFAKIGGREGPLAEDLGAKSRWPRRLSLIKSGLQIFGMACLIALVTLAKSHKYFDQNPELFWLSMITAMLGTIIGMIAGFWNFYDKYMKTSDADRPLDEMAGQNEGEGDDDSAEDPDARVNVSRRRHWRRQRARQNNQEQNAHVHASGSHGRRHKKLSGSRRRKRSLSRFDDRVRD